MGLIQKLRDGEEEIAAEVTEENFQLALSDTEKHI